MIILGALTNVAQSIVALYGLRSFVSVRKRCLPLLLIGFWTRLRDEVEGKQGASRDAHLCQSDKLALRFRTLNTYRQIC